MFKRRQKTEPGKIRRFLWRIIKLGFIVSLIRRLAEWSKRSKKPTTVPARVIPVLATRAAPKVANPEAAADAETKDQKIPRTDTPKRSVVDTSFWERFLVWFKAIAKITFLGLLYLIVRWIFRQIGLLRDYLSTPSPAVPSVVQTTASPALPVSGLIVVGSITLAVLFVWLFAKIGWRRASKYLTTCIILGVLALFASDIATAIVTSRPDLQIATAVRMHITQNGVLLFLAICAGAIILYYRPVTSPRRAAFLILLGIVAFLYGPALWYSLLDWRMSQNIPRKVVIQNPSWITARPDAFSEEVLVPHGYRFSCSAVPKGRKFQLILNNDLKAAINLNGTPGNVHIPMDTRSIRVRSLENEPVVVEITFTSM